MADKVDIEKNMSLWNSLEKTDPAQVKEITGKPYKGNSPKPYYLIRKATEVFGPCGYGWGLEIVSQTIVDGIDGDKLSVATVRFWYKMSKDSIGEIEHVGATPLCGHRSNGKPYLDEDAPKKSVTDALIKAMSMVGFAGDIFIGRYDDSKYVEEIAQEFEQDREARAKAEQDRLIHGILDAFLDMGTSEALVTMWKERVVPNAADFSDENKARLREAYVARGKVLREKERKQQEDGGHE